MSERGKIDLTRYNRPGQSRFRYLNGNGVTFLESLRAELRSRLGTESPPAFPCTPTGESVRARLDRMEQQYTKPRDPRPDWGWEIIRSFARATHVLGEHIDAYANEGFLRTALLPESVRRLVALIDYAPAPPASAVTLIALQAKDGQQGTVARGFRLSGSLPSGGAPLVFETLADTYVDWELNELRIKNFDVNEQKLGAGTKGADANKILLAKRIDGLAAGDPVLLVSGKLGQAFLIQSVAVVDHQTELTLNRAPDSPTDITAAFQYGNTDVYLKPKHRLRPVSQSATEIRLGGTNRLATNDRVAIQEFSADGAPQRIHVRSASVVGDLITLESEIPVDAGSSVSLSKLTPQTVQFEEQEGKRLLSVTSTSALPLKQDELVGVLFSQADPPTGIVVRYHVESVTADFKKANLVTTLAQLSNVADAKPTDLIAWESVAVMLDARLAVSSKRSVTVESPARPLGTKEWVVLSNGQSVAYSFCEVSQTATGALLLTPEGTSNSEQPTSPVTSVGWCQSAPSALFWQSATVAFCGFSECVELSKAHQNQEPISDSGATTLMLNKRPEALKPGMTVLVEVCDATTNIAQENSITQVDGERISLLRPVPDGATKSNLRLCGNVALAGHGEQRPERILGSGDATKARQRFLLTDSGSGVAFIADPRMPHGVRADVLVRVDGILYREVPRLEDCSPGDCVFSTRVTDAGALQFEFGDGQYGRRPPSGRDNVRVSYRQGCGLLGNVLAGTLKPMHAHALLKDARQPLPASGGSDGQDIDSLRSHAPASLQALGRAVSLGDFAALAQSHSKVWQAAAVPGWQLLPGEAAAPLRVQPVTVFVVPAGGSNLSDSLRSELEAYLNNHSLPRVRVCVRVFSPVSLQLNILLEVTQATHDPAQVVQAVRELLLFSLSLRQRRLGQAVYLSEVYKLVESVPGVAASQCQFAEPSHKSQQHQTVSSQEVLFLDPNQFTALTVTAAEYVP